MSTEDRDESEEVSWLSRHIFKLMAILAFIAMIMMASVFLIYFCNFQGPLSNEHNVWGTFGDFIGGVLNPVLSFVAFIALLFTIILQNNELRITRKEFRLSRKAQQKSEQALSSQAELMKDSATLSALGNIYSHYNDKYGAHDKTNILSHVAFGHRSWAIRESFSIIDDTFEPQRIDQVDSEYKKLMCLLEIQDQQLEHFQQIGKLLGSLLIDNRLERDKRILIWPLYELIRQPRRDLYKNKDSQLFIDFKQLASNVLDNAETK